MARGINKVILIGNLGRDPDVRYMPSGQAAANATLATSESWKDKQTGETQEKTEWHSLVFFGRLAEIAGEYLRKGSKIYVEGRLQTRKWQDKTTGADRYSTEIVVNEMQMLDSKGGAGASAGVSPMAEDRPRGEMPPRGEASGSMPPPSAKPDFDDDIPF